MTPLEKANEVLAFLPVGDYYIDDALGPVEIKGQCYCCDTYCIYDAGSTHKATTMPTFYADQDAAFIAQEILDMKA